MATSLRQRLDNGQQEIRLYAGTGAPTDTPTVTPSVGLVADGGIWTWDGAWRQLLDGASTVADHPSTACTGAAVADHPATPTSSESTGITAAGADTASVTPTAVTQSLAGTGIATVGQVVTTSDNQTVGIDALANMWLITATQAPCIIVSNLACVAAPLVMTVIGLAPSTAAEAYQVHSGAAHKHAAGAIIVTDAGHDHDTPVLAHTIAP